MSFEIALGDLHTNLQPLEVIYCHMLSPHILACGFLFYFSTYESIYIFHTSFQIHNNFCSLSCLPVEIAFR
jgi:hypothetical protein